MAATIVLVALGPIERAREVFGPIGGVLGALIGVVIFLVLAAIVLWAGFASLVLTLKYGWVPAVIAGGAYIATGTVFGLNLSGTLIGVAIVATGVVGYLIKDYQ